MACSMKRIPTAAVSVVLALALGLFLNPAAAYAGGQASLAPAGSDLGQGALATQDASASDTAASAKEASMTKFGIDVSSWQRTIDWKKTSKEVTFAILRCGYGSDDVTQDDVQWLNNVAGCQKHGVPFGVYLYSYAINNSMARSEAAHVIRCLKEAGLTASSVAFPIYLDMEDETTKGLSKSRYASIFDTFRTTLELAGYSKVGIYSSASWWEGPLSSIVLDAKYRWVAHWNSKLAEGYPKTKAIGCGIWQYGSASVTGIEGEVDANWARDDLSFFPKKGKGASKVYRLYNPNSSEHFYTTSASERNKLKKRGWSYEGVAWKSAPKPTGVAVYRLYSAALGDHHYTADAKERDRLVKKHGWKSEGVAFYVADGNEGTPVYRLYNGALPHGQHFFTQDKKERKSLVKKHGWSYEGVAFRAVG